MTTKQGTTKAAARLPLSIAYPYRVDVRDPVIGWQVCGVHVVERFALQRFADVVRAAPHCSVKLVKAHETVAQCWVSVRSYEPDDEH